MTKHHPRTKNIQQDNPTVESYEPTNAVSWAFYFYFFRNEHTFCCCTTFCLGRRDGCNPLRSYYRLLVLRPWWSNCKVGCNAGVNIIMIFILSQLTIIIGSVCFSRVFQSFLIRHTRPSGFTGPGTTRASICWLLARSDPFFWHESPVVPRAHPITPHSQISHPSYVTYWTYVLPMFGPADIFPATPVWHQRIYNANIKRPRLVSGTNNLPNQFPEVNIKVLTCTCYLTRDPTSSHDVQPNRNLARFYARYQQTILVS